MKKPQSGVRCLNNKGYIYWMYTKLIISNSHYMPHGISISFYYKNLFSDFEIRT